MAILKNFLGLCMLLRYGVENHLSICDYQEISCAASSLKDEPQFLLKAKTGRGATKDFVPIVVLYGANAAGKSNMIDALRFMFAAVERSYKHWEKRKSLPYQPCRIDSDAGDQPSTYDCDVVIGDVRYQYGFKITKSEFVAEWLYAYPNGLKKVLFQKDCSLPEKEQVYFGPSVTKLNDSLRTLAKNSKSLFLSATGSVAHETFTPVYKFFVDSMVVISANSERPDQILAEELEDDVVRKAVELFLEKADFGIIGLKIEDVKVDARQMDFQKKLFGLIREMSDGDDKDEINVEDTVKRILFVHKRADGSTFTVNREAESTGTRHLLSLIVPILSALSTGKTVVIDEITTTLHTKLSEELIKLFANEETNKNNAQFLFSTHDTNLLSSAAIRRDEIWFAEKTPLGKTNIYPLSDFQTRKSDNLERGYLQGRFGAIPFFGDLSSALTSLKK